MKLGYLLLCLAQRRRGIEGFGGGLAGYTPRQAEIETMPGVAAFGAVAVGFTAFAGSGSDGPAPEIAYGRKLTE